MPGSSQRANPKGAAPFLLSWRSPGLALLPRPNVVRMRSGYRRPHGLTPAGELCETMGAVVIGAQLGARAATRGSEGLVARSNWAFDAVFS
jgi:hypothetical protein